MKRKVIQLAGKTLVVSLPSKWTHKYGVEKGIEIDVQEKDNSIIITTGSFARKGSTPIDVSGIHPMIKRALGALYKVGYEEFDVRFNTPEELQVCQDVIREEFVGFEVVTQGRNSIVARQISKVESQEFSSMLTRVFMIIISMGTDSLEAYSKSDMKWQQTIVLRDKDINKITDFCRRVLNTQGYAKQDRTAPMYFIVEQLEKIGDLYRDLAAHLAESQGHHKKGTAELWKEVNELFKDSYSIFSNFSLKSISNFAKKRYDFKPRIQQLLRKSKEEDAIIYMHMYMIVEATFDLNGPIMQVNL